MAMSRCDYRSIAAIFAGELASRRYQDQALVALRCVILSLADEFVMRNTSFNRAKFYAACGLTENGELL